jgi:hypothetical protein
MNSDFQNKEYIDGKISNILEPMVSSIINERPESLVCNQINFVGKVYARLAQEKSREQDGW